MKKITAIPALLFGLLLSNVASAVTVQINNGFDDIYDPLTDYQVNVVVGGSQNFSFRFGFIDDAHEFELNISLPNDFPGILDWGRSSELNGSGQAYGGGYLVAGESVSMLIGGVPGSSSINPHYASLNLVAPDAPNPISIPANSPVPVPAAVWLFGSGLLGLVGIARRKHT